MFNRVMAVAFNLKEDEGIEGFEVRSVLRERGGFGKSIMVNLFFVSSIDGRFVTSNMAPCASLDLVASNVAEPRTTPAIMTPRS